MIAVSSPSSFSLFAREGLLFAQPSKSMGVVSKAAAIASILSIGILVMIPDSYLKIVCFVVPQSLPNSVCVMHRFSRAALILAPIDSKLPRPSVLGPNRIVPHFLANASKK